MKECACGRPTFGLLCRVCAGKRGWPARRRKKLARALAKTAEDYAREQEEKRKKRKKEYARWLAKQPPPHPLFGGRKGRPFRNAVLLLIELMRHTGREGWICRESLLGRCARGSPGERQWTRWRVALRDRLGVDFEGGPIDGLTSSRLRLTPDGRDRALALIAEYDKWNAKRRLK